MPESLICRYCNLPIVGTPVRTLAYWNQTPDVCHEACRREGEKTEAFDCQVVDADCNDCRHFQRGEVVFREMSAMENGKPVKKRVNLGFSTGDCLKLGVATFAYPHSSTGHWCFEHRRSSAT